MRKQASVDFTGHLTPNKLAKRFVWAHRSDGDAFIRQSVQRGYTGGGMNYVYGFMCGVIINLRKLKKQFRRDVAVNGSFIRGLNAGLRVSVKAFRTQEKDGVVAIHFKKGAKFERRRRKILG